MRRHLPILLATIWVCAAGTDALAQTENSTLRPDAPQGISLWGNKRHAKNTAANAASNAADTTLFAQTAAPIPAAKGLPAELPQEKATAQESDAKEKKEVSYIPQVDGAVKAKVEISTFDGNYRFNVRNTRFGVKGNVSRNMFYRVQVDFNNEGKLSILDSYVGYQTGGLDIRLGQQQYHFSSDLDRGPNTNFFANRSFLSKYLTSYYGSNLVDGKVQQFVSTLGSRDLGAMATYTFKTFRKRLPLKLYFGVFNGSGVNNPQWGNTVNLIGRVEIGKAEGLRVSGSYYNGSAPQHNIVLDEGGTLVQQKFKQKMNMVGAEVRYVRGNYYIEGEYARRYLETLSGKDAVLTAALVHSYYRFGLPKRYAMTYIAPMLRWDLGNDVDYMNTALKARETFDANRITIGVNFGFGKKLINSEIRLNYEKYFLKERPSDFAANKLLQDKFTIEVVAAF